MKVAHGGSTLRLRFRDNGADHYALQIAPASLKVLRVAAGVETQVGDTRSDSYPADEFLLVDIRIVGTSIAIAVDGLTVLDLTDRGADAPGSGSIALEVVTGAATAQFDDVKVVRLTGRGDEAETLLSQPFTAALPGDWVFDGATPWSIDSRGHRRLDLSTLVNVVLSIDYTHQMKLN